LDADFLIVGGGIAGVSAAARLSELGSVLLVEAEDHLAHHASGRSAAMYEPNYGARPVVELSMASGDFFRAGEGLLSTRGLLFLAKHGETEAFRHDAEAMELAEIPLDRALAMVPVLNMDILAHAAHADHGWDIDTDLLLQGFAREGSTTDVAAELTQLIQTQRAYSSNAKVIQTVDEMLQETTNIKR